MTSPAQIAANRRNASLSTGPKTAEGKAISRLNAMKHGLLAERVCTLDDGELEEFFVIYTELHTQYDPVGRIEIELVDRIVSVIWRLKRAMKIERDILLDGVQLAKHKAIRLGQAFIHDSMGANALAKLSRYERSMESSLFRCMDRLRLEQSQRQPQKHQLIPIQAV